MAVKDRLSRVNNNFKERFNSAKNSSFKDRANSTFQRITSVSQKRPLASFLIVLLLLFGLILLGNVLRPKVEEVKKPEIVKDVSVYRIGETPKITTQAQVDKAGVIKIVAQQPGVISSINVKEGQQVRKGANLIQLASSYDGSNASGIQSAIASKQYQLVKDTFQTQKDLISRQREIAEKTDVNADELRGIQDRSLGDTRSLIDQNQGIINTIQSSIETIEAGGGDAQATLQTRQLKTQFESANLQLRSQLRAAEYQAASDKPAAQISDLQKDIALKQLEIQDKTLELNKEVARLQSALAAVSASLMHPVAPFPATIESIDVKVGQAVNPGTVLLTLVGGENELTAKAQVPANIANSISLNQPSDLYINGKKVSLAPTYVSSNATEGQLYSVIYSIDEEYASQITDDGYITLDIPISIPSTTATIPFVPIDSIYQSAAESYLFVVEGDKVVSRKVELGEVVGQYVRVQNGLSANDRVITNRNVLAGDKVAVKN